MKRRVCGGCPSSWAVLFLVFFGQSAHGAITDFTEWTVVENPPDANFSASNTAAQATLSAGNGVIAAGRDIGYQSVNGATPASSTTGYAFNPAADFTVAIDFALTFANSPTGGLAIGFGIGEDGDGMNSVGAGLATVNGTPALLFGGAARVNDVTQPLQAIFVGGSLTGSLFATYDASSGDVTVGASQTPGTAGPTATATFAGIQNNWSDSLLLASFFLRSDDTLSQPWQSGSGEAVFSNFRVLEGAPVVVPEPASSALLALSGLALLYRTRGEYFR